MGGKGSGKREPKRKRHQVTGLLGVVLATDIPVRVIGTAQRGGSEMPRTCGNCHAAPPMFSTSEWEAHCMCGWDYFRLRGEIRFAATMQTAPVYAGSVGETW